MVEDALRAELETRWSAWLLARNRSATQASLWLVTALYPGFGVLDYFVAPRESLWIMWSTRGLIALVTLAMFGIVRTRFFELHAAVISAAFQVVIACGISLMTVFMGGLDSPYYAGLSLIMVGVGLLFVWPQKIVVMTHLAIIASFVLPNLVFNPQPLAFTTVSNLFFLNSSAILAIVGQIVAYRTFRDQVSNQLVIESTKANLEKAHAQLQQLDRFKSEFFANITHELKTPLTMILAPLELMIQGEMGKLSDVQRGSLQSMLRSGIKLLKLIGDLLDLSKLNESRLRLRVSEHDLVSYLRNLVTQVEPLTQRKSIALSFETNVAVCRLPCDLDRLERVFVNLLSNAAKFTPPKGSVRVSLRDEGDSVRVAVIDTGIGFPQDKAESLFERFFQVDMAGTRKFGGTGIGLSLARELIELHGGHLSAESPASGGAIFTVELRKRGSQLDPERLDRRARTEDRLEGKRETDFGIGEWQVEATTQFRLIDIEEATEQRIVTRDPDEQERAESVLVVEDTPDVIRVISLALRGHFRVLAAPGGEKGLELATTHMPGLVITDLMMPGMDGMELTRRLRADPRTRHIPIVMLTARGDVEDRVQGFESGVNAYLTKPFSAKELISTVRGLVRIQETTADLVLTHSMDSLETVAGGLAHEINNPLNYIKNAFALIQADTETLLASAPPERAATLNEITQRSKKMFGVADLGLRRIASTVGLMQRYAREGYTRTQQPYDLFAGARDVVQMLQAGLERPVATLELNGDGTIECVPEEMNQALTNLLQNALDVIPRDGTGAIVVQGTADGDRVVLSVRDNGPGIAPDHRAKIFTPFFTTKDVGKGMGLGLTIVRRVVVSLGGTIDVLNPAGGGCEMVLRIPRTANAGTSETSDTSRHVFPNEAPNRLP